MSITERIDEVTHIPDEFLAEILPPPKSVKIELSPRCNYRCGFCALRTREVQPKEDMDFELFKRITAEMREAGVEEIGVFYLGESFMNPILLEAAIRYLKQEIGMPYVFLTSNGSLATPEHVDMVMAAGLDSLKWSINAADPEQFAEVMGISGKWHGKAIANMQKAKQVRDAGGYDCGLYASSIQFDGAQHGRMAELIETEIAPFVDEVYELPLYQMGMHAEKIESNLGFSPTHGNIGRIGALRQPIPCWSAFREGHVRHDGHFSVCCFGSDSKFDVGDLKTTPFMEVWNSAEFQEIRRAHLKAGKEGTQALKGTMCEVCVAFGG